jgi:hypothetical protein
MNNENSKEHINADLPQIIEGQVTKLNKLDKSVGKALDAAEKAKESAEKAKSMSTGFWNKKEVIEKLQSAGKDLAEAVMSEAEVQRISFEFQTELAKISKYLFALGVSNITSNRNVAHELELRLKGASEEELSELARQEIKNVVEQLKAQEDILIKQATLTKLVEGHDRELKVLFQQDQQQDEQLRAQAENDKEHYALLESLQKISHRLIERVENQSQIIEVQKSEIGQLSDRLENLNLLPASMADRLFPLLSLIIASVAFVCSVILLFMR